MAAISRAPSTMINSRSSSAAGNRNASYASRISVRPRRDLAGGFRDSGHVLYYQTTATRLRKEEMTMMMGSCGGVAEATEKKMKKDEKKMKKKLKLLKGLTKDLSMLPQAGLLGEDDADGISVAAETLLKHLQEMKCEEKELKKKRKKMMKAAKSDSSSSESSDSECGDVVDLASLRLRSATESEAPKINSQAVVVDSGMRLSSIGSSPIEVNEEVPVTVAEAESQTQKIEVCLGGKCKKSGAAQLVVEFEKAVGEGAVVGCKCMGKCKDGPNVRVVSSMEASLSPPPLCIGVGLEDVGVIVANFLSAGTTSTEFASLAVAAT